jgi:hypothetical protein
LVALGTKRPAANREDYEGYFAHPRQPIQGPSDKASTDFHTNFFAIYAATPYYQSTSSDKP